MKQVSIKPRNPAMDVIRCVALFSVISVHFFLNSGFYNQPVLGKGMFVMTIMRTAFMVCVPLFLVLSGYLMCNHSISKRYYRGIITVLGIYILASIACLIYKGAILNFDITFGNAVFGILDFSAANYSWYIEMYLGLFLLIPFLNILYHNIGTKKHKLLLILTLLFLASIPNIINIYNFNIVGWWKTPTLSSTYNKLMPSWWENIYPLTYYFIGCYIKEFNLKIKKSTNILLFFGVVILFGTFNYYRSYGDIFIWGDYQSWGALPNVISTTLLFTFLANINFETYPQWFKNLFKNLSALCLGAYLVSYIFDGTFYPILNAAVPYMPHRLFYYILIVPLIFICSLALSFVITIIYNELRKLITYIYRFVKNYKQLHP